MHPKRDLFLGSALFLFLELALIRWLPAEVLFLTFFTNVVLLASFLGLSLGCLAARGRRDYLPWTAVLLAVLVAAANGMEWLRLALQDVIDVGGNKRSPQVVYFGTEVQVGDVSRFVIPIEAVAGVFFVLVALALIGAGQLIGRKFSKLPAVEAYTVNIGGSLAGVLLFQACATYTPPLVWFALAAAGVAWFLFTAGQRRWWALACAAALPLLLLWPELTAAGVIRQRFPEEEWSPYYRINYSPADRTIVTNLLGHQQMVSRKQPFLAYSIPHLLNRDAGQPRFHDILIIGAGSGNDVSRALEWSGAEARIDAVEIDPVILKLGRRDHPDRPYQDPRVTPHLGDGRNYLRSTTKQYDLIVFALIDSLVLHSSVSNLRLESYLFTAESMADVRRRLKPGGLFVLYNYFRQGWIVSRLTRTLGEEFGHPPLVLTLPARPTVRADEKAEGFTIFFAGPRSAALKDLFRQRGEYAVGDGTLPNRLRPAAVELPPDLRPATDAWPFLYLREPMIPDITWRGAAVIGLVSLALLILFGWRPAVTSGRALNAAMLALGAGFMLLETKAVVHLALLFGSTWVVNTAVFCVILLLILLANLWVLRRRPQRLAWYFIGLLLSLALNVAVPLDSFLGWQSALAAAAAGVLLLLPVLFSGVIFATAFAGAAAPEQALAYNTAGAILGGLAENASLLVGFQYLLALAAVIYAAAWLLLSRRR